MTAAEVAALCPDLPGAEVTPLGAGSDSQAWLVGGRVVVKLPRHPAAGATLAREARILAVVRPHVSLGVPKLLFFDGPPPFTRHDLLPGMHLLAADYAGLSGAQRDRLARDLARFHAECHAVPRDDLLAAGAAPVQAWPGPQVAQAALPMLPKALRPLAVQVLKDWQALPEDPLGEVWGHFDAHGWNMAFDPKARCLVGVYDFGDSGFGPRHRDLIYSALISPDLTVRLGRAYAALTGQSVDLSRLQTLSGAHRLWELALAPPGEQAAQCDAFARWAAAL